jgi:hypothetical protein
MASIELTALLSALGPATAPDVDDVIPVVEDGTLKAATTSQLDVEVFTTGMPAASSAQAKAGTSNVVAMTPASTAVVHPYYDIRNYGTAVADGVTDATAAIAAAISAAPAGSTILFPDVGTYLTDPITVTKRLRFQGQGRWQTVLKPRVLTTGTLLDCSLATGTAADYGTEIVGLGIDLSNSPAATGIKLGVNTHWCRLTGVRVSDGAVSIDNRGFNNKLHDVELFDAATNFLKVDGDTGTELSISKLTMARNTAGTTACGILIESTVGSGIKGAVWMSDVKLQVNVSGGGVVTTGMKIVASVDVSLPLFATNVVLDNVTGGGAALELVRVRDIHFHNGWLNAAGASTNGAVRIEDGGDIWITGNNLYGGASSGCSFDFAGGTTDGIFLSKNRLATQPFYKMPASGKPTNLYLDDVTTTAITQLTNDAPSLFAALGARGVYEQAAVFGVALSDETTTITTGTAKATVRSPYSFVVTAVRASLSTVSTSGVVTVDINEAGTTILSTKLTIDANEKTSTTAATPAVISTAGLDWLIDSDAELTFDIDTAGTGAKGLKVWVYGHRI